MNECLNLLDTKDLQHNCGWSAPLSQGSLEGDRPVRCPVCGDPRLFVQKDFSRKMGLALLLGGFALAVLLGVFVGPWGFFGTLVAAAAFDTFLYLVVCGNVVVCHWCEAHLRGGPEDYDEFDLELHDVVRYQKEVAAVGKRVPEHEGDAPAGKDAEEMHPREFDD
ncbi:MAG: hypothetical protein ACYTDX_03975 [Planctomycetota bacterium]